MAAMNEPYTSHRSLSFSKFNTCDYQSKSLRTLQQESLNTQLATPFPSMADKSVVDYLIPAEDDGSLQISDFFDIPLLISDNGEEDSESESLAVSKLVNSRPSAMNDESTEVAAQVIKRYLREEFKEVPDPNSVANQQVTVPVPPVEKEPSASVNPEAAPSTQTQAKIILGPEAFKNEHEKVMKIIVKYVAMKITNSFPPQAPKKASNKELELDEFLMVLVSRLQLSMVNFMKGIIYLFRYMDIIYLLRYLNQSNNFANYTDMGFGLRKLIVGCFRLVLARERIVKDWKQITGLTNVQINAIVKTVIGRLNGKLNIKNTEVLRLKNEIFRFIQMVTKSV